MKKVLTILLVVLLIFSVGCTVQEVQDLQDLQVTEDMSATSSNEMPEGAAEGSAAPLVFYSVEEIPVAVQKERQAKDKDHMAQTHALEKLSVLYAPANEIAGYELWSIDVSRNRVCYRYVPEGEGQGYVEMDRELRITLYRNAEASLDKLCAQFGVVPDETGFAYCAERRMMLFEREGMAISIEAPEHMNDYDTIRGLCEMQRVSIPWIKGDRGTEASETDDFYVDVELCKEMPIFSSVDEVISTVQSERQSELKSALAQSGELESLSMLYVPANAITGFRLHSVEVTPDRVFSYYVPEGEMQAYFCWERRIIFTQYRSEDVTLQSICNQYGLTLNEDGCVYDEENWRVFYEEDNTVISMQVPEYMNDYETMLILSEMEKIEIP